MRLGAMPRRRGHDWEREIAGLLRELDPEARTARQAAPLEDAKGRDIVTRLPLVIQAKAGRRVAVARAFKEALEARRLGDQAVLMVHDTENRLKLAVVDLRYFMWMQKLIKSHIELTAKMGISGTVPSNIL